MSFCAEGLALLAFERLAAAVEGSGAGAWGLAATELLRGKQGWQSQWREQKG